MFEYDIDDLKDIKILAPLSKKQELYLNDNKNEIVVWGGSASSGKSFISGLNILLSGLEDKDYRAGIVRKTKEQLKGAGSLFDECSTMYADFPIRRMAGSDMKFVFEVGAEVKFSYSDRPSDKHNFQGWQVTEFLVDEAQQLLEENVIYLISRLRSKSKRMHQLKLTCNPEYDSYLRVWLEDAGYLDEEGYANPEMDGVTTYYCEVAGEVKFCKTLEEVKEKYGYLEVDAMPFVFYSATVHDNPWVARYSPRYISKLKNLPPLERARLYEGCWYAKEESAGYFKREWVEVIEPANVSLACKRARAWDRAATLPSDAQPNPDWSVGVKGYIEEDGTVVIEDAVRLRDRAAVVLKTIEQKGIEDGRGCIIGIPQDVGAAGKESSELAYAHLLKCGLNALINKTRANKLARFEPFAIAAHNRRIKIVRGAWNKWFLDELETFDGVNKSRRNYHDDVADATADLFSMLTNSMFFIQIQPSKRTIHRDTKLVGLHR